MSSRLLSLAVPEQQEGGGGGGWLLWAEPFRWGERAVGERGDRWGGERADFEGERGDSGP